MQLTFAYPTPKAQRLFLFVAMRWVSKGKTLLKAPAAEKRDVFLIAFLSLLFSVIFRIAGGGSLVGVWSLEKSECKHS